MTPTPAADSSTRSHWTPWRCWNRAGARSPACCPADSPNPIWETLRPKNFRPCPASRKSSGLHEVGELAASGDWDHVVVDCASTADAMRMLTLPSTFGLYLERAWPRHRRLSTGADDPQSAAVVALLERIGAGTEQLGALLTDGSVLTAHLVMTAERVVAAEAARTLGSLALMGVVVDELIVNQILMQDDSFEYRNLPEHPAFDWYAERISEQQAVLDELDTTIGDVAAGARPASGGGADRRQGARRTARQRAPPRRRAAAGAAAAGGGPGVRIRTRSRLPDATRVAAGRLLGAVAGPGRRRPDHRRRRYAAPSSAGIRPASMHRDGRPAARQ